MRTFLLVSLLALGVGCKDKPKHREPPKNVGSAAVATGSGSGSAGTRANATPAPDLVLPRGDGTPPKKTTAPIPKEDLERIAASEFPGFKLELKTVNDKAMEVRHKTNDHPRLWSTVTVQHCLDCVPMELDKWKAKEQDLRVFMGALKDAKEGVEFEVGKTELYGQTIIYTYQIGMATVPGEGGGSTTFTNAFIAYYNDGQNMIRVLAEYKDDPTTIENMKKLAPKEDLRALALSFLDYYTHIWVK